jgi:hypothetical protein
MPDFNSRFAYPLADTTDAHRPLEALHSLAASLSHARCAPSNDYTIPFPW